MDGRVRKQKGRRVEGREAYKGRESGGEVFVVGQGFK